MPRRPPKRPFRRAAKALLLLLAALLLLPAVQVAIVAFWNPAWSPMQFQRRIEAAREGKPRSETPRRWTPLEDIPDQLVHFIWASEDQAFFDHRGFDLQQMHRAIRTAQKTGQPVRGSSTITMQCARSVFLWQGRSYPRKALEAYYTLWMELLLTKPRILELYLNHIEFGPGIYGIGSASEKYFHKKPSQLTRSQMIALAAILPNPLEWSPTHPDKTVQRKIRRIERLAARAPFPSGKIP